MTFEQFLGLDVRAGTILSAEPLARARRPALKLVIDFGPGVGTKRSTAQIAHYDPAALVGRQVGAVVNFAPRQVGASVSEVLTLGFPDAEGRMVLFSPDLPVSNGARLF